ncbi:hypothetical protein F4782DRAFT_113522 [Xylaria castorea]|nr:hypothetical protein F4782DRAFT_113522 [Xylaria castorea]
MPLFRWGFGARNSGAPAVAGYTSQDGTNGNSNPPPSYEESQDASLRAVLQGAIAVAPVLWPSACSSFSTRKDAPSSLAPGDKCRGLDAGGEDKEKQDTMRAVPTPNTGEEDAIMQVLINLAMAPCGDHPFLDRIRDFSDFYFTPYIASEGAAIQSSLSSSSKGKDSGGSSSLLHRETRETVPVQERQRKALQNLEVPRESAALVLCARVLEDYYAGLGHMDSAVDIDIAWETSTPYQQFPKEKTTTSSNSSSSAKAAKGRSEQSPIPKRTKTKLTQIAACLEEECTCCDYDEAAPAPAQQPKTVLTDHSPSTTTATSPSLSQRCGCGHPRTSHAPSSPLGISRLLRRYTNWDCASYLALRHRSSTGQTKRRIHDVEVCGGGGGGGASGGCPCRDYDKGRRTGRCARCGHYYKDHLLSIKAAREQDKNHGEKREKGKSKDGPGTTGGSDSKKAECELSWILVENAYLLLNHITPISRGKH